MSQMYSENRKHVNSMSVEIKTIMHSSALPACYLNQPVIRQQGASSPCHVRDDPWY